MKQEQAWTTVRAWFDEYGRTVRFALTRYGVPADLLPDLVQEVFSTAYVALLRDEPIERPRAWLRGVARGHASNYRRKAGHAGHELVSLDEAAVVVDPGPSTDRQVEARERLRLIFDRMDLEAQEILLDVHMENMSFEDIALERGISAGSARYLYQKAVQQAEDAVKSLDSKTRGRIMLPLAFIELIHSVRAESEISPETHRHILESLERRLGTGKLGGKDQPEADHANARPSRMSPISMRVTNPAASWHGPALVALVGGLAIGGICGWLLHTPKGSQPTPFDLKRTTPTLAEAESTPASPAPGAATFASTDAGPLPPAEGMQSHAAPMAP
ncbi:MAG: sigma-70 family RNA polymerase sigma factor, partial [Byssovorax sp.]